MLNKNKDVISIKINLLKRQIDASDKELLAMRGKAQRVHSGQTKAKGSGKGGVAPKFASLLLKKKKELKQASGAIFKEIFVAAKEIELKTAGEEETAVKVAADSQPVKRWSFQMYGSTKGNRSASVEPQADSSTARLP